MKMKLKWIVISLLFLFSLVAMILAYLFNTKWPEENLHLSASDMKLTRPVSTSLCESLDLTSDHPFLAHHVTDQAKINPFALTRNTMDFSLDMEKFRRIQLNYYLLPESVLTLVVCASSPGSHVYIFKGKCGVNDRVKRHVRMHEDSEENESTESHADFGERHEDRSEEDGDTTTVGTYRKTIRFKNRLQLLRSQEIPPTYANDALMCQFTDMTRLIQVNITEADTYGILFHNNINHNNHLNIRLIFDRTTYHVNKDISNFHICPAGTTCTVPLSFRSRDRALVWIPSEPNAGLKTYTIHAQCRPRFTLFATLIIVAPILIFSLAVLFLKISLHFSSGYSAVDQSSGALTANSIDEKDTNGHTILSFCLLKKNESSAETEEIPHFCTNQDLPTYEDLCEEHPPPYNVTT